MQTIKIDPEFQSLIPPLSPDEYAQLEANILADGCRDALVVWDGTLIDGHNRVKICTEHNITYQTIEKALPDRQAAIEWIIRNQFGRRNLLPFQRSELALKLSPIISARAKENMIATQNNKAGAAMQKTAEQIDTREALAKIAGVSHDTISKASVIKNRGTTEQITRARQGGTGNTVRAIYSEIKKSESAPTHAEIAPIKTPMTNPITSFKAIVADMKDLTKDRSLTPEKLLDEYQIFADEIIHRFEWYKQERYINLYPQLSKKDQEKLTAINTAMSRAVEKINEVQKGNLQ